MYRTIDDFVGDWLYESRATMKILRSLTDASLGQRVTPDGRSLGLLAWHIVLTLEEMGGRAGLQVTGPGEHAPVPSQASVIASAYEEAATSLREQVKTRWTDASLLEELEMYGDKWTRGTTLAALIRHQAHHRAQMTILMRQAGLSVPGVYGPSREEWARMGLPPRK